MMLSAFLLMHLNIFRMKWSAPILLVQLDGRFSMASVISETPGQKPSLKLKVRFLAEVPLKISLRYLSQTRSLSWQRSKSPFEFMSVPIYTMLHLFFCILQSVIYFYIFLLLQVSWKPPLIQNGEILNYEIRMPDPRIVIAGNSASTLSYLVTNLLPYTNYSITVVACSGGNGLLGGCTESLPTSVTTPSTAPEGISPLSVTPISESFIAISWQPPLRPNGPHLR